MTAIYAKSLADLSRDGAMTLLALDQRASLRTMLAAGGDESLITDADVASFKKTAATVLAPVGTGILLDLEFGRDAIAALPKGTPIILAADRFDQPPGQTVQGSTLDPEITVELIQTMGVTALKFLTLWKDGIDVAERAHEVSRFVALARKAGVVSLLEGIVRQSDGSGFTDADAHGKAVIAAAVELAAFGPDVYKAEVPGYRRGDLGLVKGYSEQLTKALSCPWVVLSSGVDAVDFPEAVRLSVEAGASGFLAGRAIWADAARSADPHGEIERVSIGRFERLVESVRLGRSAQ